jgi:hypothetical protein
MQDMTGETRNPLRSHIPKKHGELPSQTFDDQSSTRIHGEKTDEFYSTYKTSFNEPAGHGIRMIGRRDEYLQRKIMQEM